MDGILLKKETLGQPKLVKGNYEGYDFYKMIVETSSGIKLQAKLTKFEYNTLLSREK